MMNEETELSPSGQARRDEILRLAMSQARFRRGSRKIVRAGLAAIIIAVAGAVMLVGNRSPAPVLIPAPAPVATGPHTAPESITRPVITYIQTDPTIVQRLSIRSDRRTWTVIGDAELLQTLADSGHPAGIVYHDGQAMLMPR